MGRNLNSQSAKTWLQETCRNATPWFFIGTGQLLKPWWIDIAQSRVINIHSAVLPYARGVNAIENVAALEDIAAFRQAAGFTIHYVDAGVDTGAIIRAERIQDPFQFQSIWELKSYTYLTSFA